MDKITPFLWFNDKAEEAANFYVSLFPNSRIVNVTRSGERVPGPKGSVMMVAFALDGREYMALNGGPHYALTPAFSLFVHCETQDEIDRYWSKLLEGGGAPSQCGWLTDRYGLSWQIVPNILGQLMGDKDPARAGQVVQAMLKMVKLDISELKRAYEHA